ncbi:MAG: YjjW family glycine radical enzyme activase [Tissierellia bacterium]|nr:YjjW family glycine radical enzyme activase [Tissierellia bacterium]
MKEELRGLVNKIIPMSVVDGEGNRMAIFFQGCNFNCKYCHNPETINLCNHCGHCVAGCPSGALSVEGGKVRWDWQKCIHCDRCIEVCPHNSSPKVRHYTAKELGEEMERAMPFIQGITTSGGECTLQWEFLVELYEEAHRRGLTAFTDTNGSLDLSQERYRPLVSASDGFLLDVKAWDIEEHRALTGRDNTVVLKNLSHLSHLGKIKEIRVVLLEGMDHGAILRGIGENATGLEKIDLKLISYRPFGVRKEYQYLRTITPDEKAQLVERARNMGFHRVIPV